MPDARRIDMYRGKAWKLFEAGRVDLAMKEMDKARALDPEASALDLEQGVMLFKSALLSEALERFEAVIAKDPENLTAYVNTAKTLLGLERAEEGLQQAEACLAINADHVGGVLAAGLCELALDRAEAALARFERAVELAPREGQPLLRVSQALRKLERYEEALAAARKSGAVRQGYDEANHEKGLCLWKVGRVTEAWKVLSELVRSQGQKADRQLCLDAGAVAMDLKMHSAALTLADKICANDQNDADAWLLKGRAQEGSGDVAAGAICQGTAHMVAGRYEEALVQVDRALELKPRYTPGWCNRAVILEKLGRMDDALAAYDSALKHDSEAYVVWHNKGALLYKLKRQDEAVRCFRKEVRIDPDRWFKLPSAIRLLVDRYK